MDKYQMPVSWKVDALVTVEAESLEDAVQLLYDDGLLQLLQPSDREYIPDSFVVHDDLAEVIVEGD